MLYSQEELKETKLLLQKRRLIIYLPSLFVFLLSIGIFIFGRIQKSSSIWILSYFLAILAGCFAIFFHGVYIKPVATYKKHLEYMLNGRMSQTKGYYKSISPEINEREGLQCCAFMLNIGTKNDPEDDRLFYYDALKPEPEFSFGTYMNVYSNNKMISAFDILQDDSSTLNS